MDEILSDKDLINRIRSFIETDNYVFTEHANKQAKKRKATVVDVLHVLKNGKHEEKKTLFSIKNQSWHYAINGKTTERLTLRVIVAIEDDLVIITVINLPRN